GALDEFGAMTGEDVYTWRGYLNAHRARRAQFIGAGATATDHGHITARTADLSDPECQRLFGKVVKGELTGEDAETFRAQMLTEMARMSLADGLVVHVYPSAG